MQYGYGMADTHQQQFMEGESCSSLFPISTPQKQSQHHHLHYQRHHYLPPPPQQLQQRKHERQQQQIFQLRPLLFTQQLLQQQHQIQAFQLQQRRRLHPHLRLENELDGDGGGGEGRGEGVDNGGGGESGAASLPFFNFKLGLNEHSDGNREVVVNEEDEDQGGGLIGGSEEHIPWNRPNSLEMPQCCWQSQEDGTIKEPFWKPLNSHLFNKNDKENDEAENEKKEEEANKKMDHAQVLENNGGKNLGNKYRFFGELEAICSAAGLGETNRKGSGSALTGENMARNSVLLRPLADPHCSNFGVAGAAGIGVDHRSDTSTGEEASLWKLQRRKRRKKMKEELNSMAGFFESLVKQLIDNQESLYRKFLEVVERIDQERLEREEAWRSQQLQNFNREATARAQEQALASSREHAIASYLEKITGQTLDLPDKKNSSQLHAQPYLPKEATKINSFSSSKEATKINSYSSSNRNSRWPKAEVQALIQVRSSLESRFQEPGLKVPPWEEISSSMASMGYLRSAKRCKEKWENINKYFRKTKDSAKKRFLQSKTCPYFHQLNQLYSRTPFYPDPSASTNSGIQNLKGNSELLGSIMATDDPDAAQKIAPMESFDGNIDDNAEVQQINHGKEKENHSNIGEGEQDVNNVDEDEDEEDDE